MRRSQTWSVTTASTCWWISPAIPPAAGCWCLHAGWRPCRWRMLGHGYTSGLSAMDAFLADATLTPPGADALFSERIIRLPRVPLAYAPDHAMPPVGPLPALGSGGHITFGYFGRTE